MYMVKNSDVDKSIDTTTTTNSSYSNPFSYSSEIIEKIPLIGQRFSSTKQTKESQIHIEKRWATSLKKIEIPINYEEIYIDGKRIDSYSDKEFTKVFSKIKNKIKNIFIRSKNQENLNSETLQVKYYDAQNNAIINEKQNAELDKSSPLSSVKKNQKIENVITVWGEEIVIDKRKVKLGEFVIKKYEVTESKKIDVELITEKLTIHNPNSSKEEII
jgi:stress response protein YsnF